MKHHVNQQLRRAEAKDVAALHAFQQEAYAHNRELLGVEPLPLQADYHKVVAEKECWLAETGHRIDGALILEVHGETMLIWSLAIAPRLQGTGLGSYLIHFAEGHARHLEMQAMTLYTGEKLVRNINWYMHHGFRLAGREELPDRVIVHMTKQLA